MENTGRISEEISPFIVAEEAEYFKKRKARRRVLLKTLKVLAVLYAILAVVFIAWRVVMREIPRTKKPLPINTSVGMDVAAIPPSVPAAVKMTPPNLKQMISDAERVGQVLSEADGLASRGLLDESVSKLERQLGATPDVLELKYALGSRYIQQNRFDRAGKLFLDVLASDPKNTEARLKLANVLYSVKDFQGAYDAALWTLAVTPADLRAHRIAARAARAAGNYGDAIPHLRSLLAVRPGDNEARHSLALTYLRLGQYAEAINHFNILLAQENVDSAVFFNFASCYAQQQQVLDAVRILALAADRVGASLVKEWLKSDDFAPIQDDPAFVRFEKDLERELPNQPSTPENITAAPAEEPQAQAVPPETTAAAEPAPAPVPDAPANPEPPTESPQKTEPAVQPEQQPADQKVEQPAAEVSEPNRKPAEELAEKAGEQALEKPAEALADTKAMPPSESSSKQPTGEQKPDDQVVNQPVEQPPDAVSKPDKKPSNQPTGASDDKPKRKKPAQD